MRLLLLLLFIYPAMGQSWEKLEEGFKTKWERKVYVNDTILIETIFERGYNDSLCQIRDHVWERTNYNTESVPGTILKDTPTGSFIFYPRRESNLVYECIRCHASKLIFRKYCTYKQVWP